MNASLLMTLRPSRASTWREEPHEEHVNSRGKLSAATTPAWPQGQAILRSMAGEENAIGACRSRRRGGPKVKAAPGRPR